MARTFGSDRRASMGCGLTKSPCRGCRNVGRDKGGHDPMSPCNTCLRVEQVRRTLSDIEESRFRRRAS